MAVISHHRGLTAEEFERLTGLPDDVLIVSTRPDPRFKPSPPGSALTSRNGLPNTDRASPPARREGDR
jgi:hypothetical protein